MVKLEKEGDRKRSSRPPKVLKGPPAVIPWYERDPRRDGSPCVIARKFGYVLTHHKRLKEAEDALKAARERRASSCVIADLEARVANQMAWLKFSEDTLESCLKFAQARLDGSLEQYQPSVKGRGKTNKHYHEQILHYVRVFESWKLAKTAAAGHSKSNEAMEKLMSYSEAVVAVFRRKSGREADDADQQAMLGLLQAANEYDPLNEKRASFNTFARWKIMRATQIRKASHCAPGKTMVNGKIVTRGHIEVTDEESRSDAFHPVTQHDDARELDVQHALAQLTEDERELIDQHVMQNVSIRQLAEERGQSVHVLRNTIKKAKEKLARLLEAHRE